MLKALFAVNTQGPKGEKRPFVKPPVGHWAIAIPMKLIEMDLQSMIDAMPAKGGELYVSGGVYDLTEPLRIPDTESNITVIGCRFNGDAKVARVVDPGTIRIEGCDSRAYWNGTVWKAKLEEALSFETKEAAEKAAFELVSKQMKFFAALEIVKV